MGLLAAGCSKALLPAHTAEVVLETRFSSLVCLVCPNVIMYARKGVRSRKQVGSGCDCWRLAINCPFIMDGEKPRTKLKDQLAREQARHRPRHLYVCPRHSLYGVTRLVAARCALVPEPGLRQSREYTLQSTPVPMT